MAKLISIRQHLRFNLLMVVLLLGGTVLLATVFGTQRAVRALTGLVISRTLEQVQGRLEAFFEPIHRQVEIVRFWGESGILDLDDADTLNRLFLPIIREHPQISSVLVADENGREHMLLRFGSKWVNRQTHRALWQQRSKWREWRDGEEPVESWRDLDYDPRRRPWFRGALAHAQHRDDAAPTQVYWTMPYVFFTTKDPGMTAAAPFRAPDGRQYVVGFDVLLNDISRFTIDLEISPHGQVVVMTENGRLIGLPKDFRDLDSEQRRSALLKRPSELGVQLAVDAERELADPANGDGPVRFRSEGVWWWGQLHRFPLNERRRLITVVLMPEEDVLGELSQIRLWIIMMTGAVLLFTVYRSFTLARRYSAPIEALVDQSNRIRLGDLDAPLVISSRIREVAQLASAHDQMRAGLKSLLKLEADLKLARAIQQNTLPRAFPSLRQYDIFAWGEPADETGGDTFDVIGFRLVSRAETVSLSLDTPDYVVLLMADATGHGVGPALSATQIRSMLRMAVRMGADLERIAFHINDQLCADLHGGRFITAWLGRLNVRDHVLTGFSAGQAPLLFFQAKPGRFRRLGADAPPFGIQENMAVSVHEPIKMASGDIFLVVSDGIFEAQSDAGEIFGVSRVEELVCRHRNEPARAIVASLQDEIKRFTREAPTRDDRTVIIIKRH